MKALTCIWMVATAVGFYALLEYGSTPGEAGRLVPVWPADSQLIRDPNRANLVLAVHPHCPCSRVTIDALFDVMSRYQGLATVNILFYRPADFSEDWEKTSLWHRAALIPGVRATCDEGGIEANRFGAMTSGHVLLYSPEGRMLFSGGITVSRGHQGGNPGLDALISCLTLGEPDLTPRPVFGCPLQNHEGAQR